MTGMDFGDALRAVRQGKRVRRIGWNGKGMWVAGFGVGDKFDGLPVDPCLCMKTAQNTIQPGWLASQADMLAVDWEVVK
jgi:hypothetical protein